MTRAPARLYVDDALADGVPVTLARPQVHYLKDVMRRADGDDIVLFNGRDGEWRAVLSGVSRKAATATPAALLRPQPAAAGPRLVFAPVKKAGTDFIIEKATELGAARLSPVTTAFTDTGRINLERARAHAIEAAEQCRRLDVPVIDPPAELRTLLDAWPADRPLCVADEQGGGRPLLAALEEISQSTTSPPGFVIGPQGGFSETELVFMRGLAFVTTVDLGPRILRAETAVAAVLSCWQAARGDWRDDHSNPAG